MNAREAPVFGAPGNVLVSCLVQVVSILYNHTNVLGGLESMGQASFFSLASRSNES